MMTHRSVFPKLAVFPIDLGSMMELSSSKKFPSYGHLTGLEPCLGCATYRPQDDRNRDRNVGDRKGG